MLKVVTVYDSKSGVYGRPFYMPATAAAIRSFIDEVNSGSAESMVTKHPEDFTLFELGQFDESTGSFDLYETKRSLGVGVDFKRVEQ